MRPVYILLTVILWNSVYDAQSESTPPVSTGSNGPYIDGTGSTLPTSGATISETSISDISPTTPQGTASSEPSTVTNSPIPTTTPVPTTVASGGIPLGTQDLEFTTADETTDYEVTVEDGYFISVTVSDVDMDAVSKNYLYIIGGPEYDINTQTDGRVFTNQVKGPYKFLFQANSVLAHIEIGSVDATHQFKIVFSREGTPKTTVTTVSTTEISLPTTDSSDSVYLHVNVTGKPLKEYSNKEVVQEFRTCVLKMVDSYCKAEGVTPTDPVVMIDQIIQCPYFWPNSDQCVQIQFKVPMFYESDKWTGYQMNTNHLETMWSTYSKDISCISVENVPNFGKIAVWWAIGIIFVTVAFIVLLCFLKFTTERLKMFMLKRRRRRGETTPIISSHRSSMSLQPHYLQETPKFFEN